MMMKRGLLRYKGIELWVGNGPNNDGIYGFYSETDNDAIVIYYDNGKLTREKIYAGSYSYFASGHVQASIDPNDPIATTFSTPEKLTGIAFTQDNVFREFVRAAEGIPRDAFSILSLAAQNSTGIAISMDTVRKSSKTWYQRDKETAVAANLAARKLLHWIVDEVIGHRRSRAFLLEGSQSHVLIDNLFDDRVIHLLKRNISAHDQPGVRYDVYKIDYGCYVDLLSTASAFPTEALKMRHAAEFQAIQSYLNHRVKSRSARRRG
jgi:hypothetical protein